MYDGFRRLGAISITATALLLWGMVTGGVAQAADTVPPIGPLPPVTDHPDNRPSEARIALGRSIFFDNRISDSGTINCATCHIPSLGWTVPTPISPAHPGKIERRNSPTLLNVGYVSALIWDGRAPSLEKQALGSLKNPVHKNQDIEKLIKIYNDDPDMVRLFRAAYGTAPNPDDIGKALAVFQRHVIVTGDSPFDLYMKGDKSALDESAVRGMALFNGKARCIACHNGPNFTDSKFYNVGLKHNTALDDANHQAILKFDAKRMGIENWEQTTTDPGRYLVTHEAADWGRFKTPTLRNLADTGPYMHDGRYATLDEVIEHFDRGGDTVRNKDPRIEPLRLSTAERADLKAFLLALRGPLPDIRMQDWVKPVAPSADSELDGKALFDGKATCINCHQADGKGVPGVFPPLAGNTHVSGGDGSYVARVILHGRSGHLEVDGNGFTATMPPIGILNNLSDAEVAAVANYVRNAWGNRTDEVVTPGRVAKVR